MTFPSHLTGKWQRLYSLIFHSYNKPLLSILYLLNTLPDTEDPPENKMQDPEVRVSLSATNCQLCRASDRAA